MSYFYVFIIMLYVVALTTLAVFGLHKLQAFTSNASFKGPTNAFTLVLDETK